MCSVEATLTLSELAQTTSVAACATFTGSIAIGDNIVGDLILDGIEVITNDLIVADAPSLSQLGALNLHTIEGTLRVENAPQLSTLALTNLTNIGTLNLTNTGSNLHGVDLPALGRADVVYINGTSLQTIDGLAIRNITGHLEITGNTALQSINLAIQNIGSGIDISSNNDNTAVSFPDLVTAGYINIASASSINLPLLQSSSLHFINNTLTNLSLPAFITSTSFVIENNANLTMLTAPVLQTAALAANANEEAITMQITGNPQLDQIGFHSLAQVDGALFNGTFKSISLDSLKNMTRDFTIYSTSDISTTCTQLHTLQTEDVIKGSFSCSYLGQNSSTTSNGTGSGNSQNTGHDANKGGVIGGSVGGVVAFFVLVGLNVVAVVFWRMRRRDARRGVGIELRDSPRVGYGDRERDNPFAG